MKQTVNIIRRHWLPLLGLNSILLAVTAGAVIYASMAIPPVWKANALLNLPQTTGKLDADLGTLGNLQNSGPGFNKDLNPLEIQLSILTSNVVLERVWAADPEKSLYLTLSDYKGVFEAKPAPLTTTITIEAQGSRPDLAYKRLNKLIEVYQQRLNELRHMDANAREQFVQDQVEKARSDLNQAQLELANFRRSTGITDIAEQTRVSISAINQLRTTQATIFAQAQASETQASVAAARYGMTTQQAINYLRLGENKEYQAIRQKLSDVDNLLAEARGTYTDQSPKVRSLMSQRQELLSQLNQRIAVAVPGANVEELDTTLGGNGSTDSRIAMIVELIKNQTSAQGLLQQARKIQNQINRLNIELSYINANQARLADLQRRYDIAEGVYKGILAQGEQAKTNPFDVYPNVHTLDEPVIDPKPSTASRKLIAAGGILAAIFSSIALIFFLETRNPLLKPKDLQQVEFPVLGSIPRLQQPEMERNLTADIEIEFQRLASAILMLENQCLMVTSANSGEGKTTVTLGLALALVNFGFRVLVVDGDFRQAQMSRRFGHAQSKTKVDAQPTPVSVYPGLDLMPAASIPKDKIAEYFARGAFERCINRIKNSGCYDYVLVDSAPVGLASETNLMSIVVGNVLFVVRAGSSDRYPVMNSFEQLTRHNARIMGLVINGVDSQNEGYRYGYGSQRELLETET